MTDVLEWFLGFLGVLRGKAAARAAAVEAGEPAVVKGLPAGAAQRVRATQKAVDEAIALCRGELAAEADKAAREAASSSGSGSGSGTALDASLVVLAGAWAYSAFGLARAGGFFYGSGHPIVPDELAAGPLGAFAGLGGRVLPLAYAGAERALALVLLLASLARLVFGREAARAV
jgi:hypothetical protein